MRLKDYLELSHGYCCLFLSDTAVKTKVFDSYDFNSKSRILNRKIIKFWSVAMEGKIVQCIKVECKNLNDIKDFFSKEY